MPPRPAGSLSYAEAASRMGCHYETVRDHVARGTFTDLRPIGPGRGRRGFVPADEVEAYRQGQESAVAELKKRRGKIAVLAAI